jgi:hypothetical protein
MALAVTDWAFELVGVAPPPTPEPAPQSTYPGGP